MIAQCENWKKFPTTNFSSNWYNIYFFQSDTTLEIEKMDKANATWSDELAPSEAGENTPQSQVCQLVMDHDQILRELSVNVISLFTICVKRDIHEWQFSPFFVNLSEKQVRL